LNINNACQTCHNVPEDELRDKVATIQGRTEAQFERAATAMTDMLDAIREAQAAGATKEELAPILDLQARAIALRAPAAPKVDLPVKPVEGVTSAGDAPPSTDVSKDDTDGQ
jgi:formate-dependent nitrite reductase cytochrome c552 subunit